MNIIFLDIDGTLNRFGREDFEPACVAALNRIIAVTSARVVLSSSWRYKVHQGHTDLAGLATILRVQGGVRGELIDVTRGDEGDESRWRQIADWLKSPVVKIDRYCILDDDSDAFGGRPGVRTKSYVGLTEADADAAIRILKPDNERT